MNEPSLAALRAALAAAPGRLRSFAARVPALDFDPRAVRCFCVTGVGSSAAHARFLTALLAEQGGLPARFVPLDAFPRAGDPADVLVVFSQALSPNARLALTQPEDWRSVLLVTAATPLATRSDARCSKACEAGACASSIRSGPTSSGRCCASRDRSRATQPPSRSQRPAASAGARGSRPSRTRWSARCCAPARPQAIWHRAC